MPVGVEGESLRGVLALGERAGTAQAAARLETSRENRRRAVLIFPCV
jgi:hypothetical protein